MRRIVFVALLAFTLVGCSEQQMPIMTVDQQKSYNSCMGDHWSSGADSLFWGPFGWAWYESVRKDCIAVSSAPAQGSTVETAVAPPTPAGGVQPVSTTKPAPEMSPH
jgi:hypothetical protein